MFFCKNLLSIFIYLNLQDLVVVDKIVAAKPHLARAQEMAFKVLLQFMFLFLFFIVIVFVIVIVIVIVLNNIP